jgi:hypothetical protein
MEPRDPIMTFCELAGWLAEQSKAQPADLAPLGEQLRALDPTVTAALVAPLVAGLHTFQARAKAAGVTSTELHVMRGLAATSRMWAAWVRNPASLEGEGGAL